MLFLVLAAGNSLRSVGIITSIDSQLLLMVGISFLGGGGGALEEEIAAPRNVAFPLVVASDNRPLKDNIRSIAVAT